MSDIRTQGDLDRATAALLALQERGLRMYRGACRPACGVRYRGWPERPQETMRLWAPGLGRTFEVLLGVDLHVDVPGGFEFDGAPLSWSDDTVTFSVVWGERICGEAGCGHPEVRHGVKPVAGAQPPRLDHWCLDCLDGFARVGARHEPLCPEPVRGEPL